MLGRKMEYMLMARIPQECPPLPTSAEVVDHKGHLARLGHHTADIEAPVGVEVIHHPVVTLHVWQLLDNMGPMGGEIGSGAWQVYEWPSTSHPDVERGEKRLGRPGRGASCKPLRPCAR